MPTVRRDIDLSWVDSMITTKGWVTIHGHHVLLGADGGASGSGGSGGSGGGGGDAASPLSPQEKAKNDAIAAWQNYYVHGQGKLADYNRELKRLSAESGLPKAELESAGSKHYQESQKKATATAIAPATVPSTKEGMVPIQSGGHEYLATSNVKAAQMWGDAKYADWASKLSSDERKAFVGYSKGGDQAINNNLRYGKVTLDDETKRIADKISTVQTRIGALDGALARSAVPEAVQVHRGFTHPGLLAQMAAGETLAGSTFVDKGYVSTSVAAGGKFSGQPIVARINVRKGAKGAYMGGQISKFPEETEMLLPRGSEFRITGYARVKTSWGSQWELYMDYGD